MDCTTAKCMYTAFCVIVTAGKSSPGQAVCTSEHAEDGRTYCTVLLSANETGLPGSSGKNTAYSECIVGVSELFQTSSTANTCTGVV